MSRRREVKLEATRYRIVECSTVTDEELERIVNEGISKGLRFEAVQFAMREASKRPAMAFVFFTTKEKGNA